MLKIKYLLRQVTLEIRVKYISICVTTKRSSLVQPRCSKYKFVMIQINSLFILNFTGFYNNYTVYKYGIA